MRRRRELLVALGAALATGPMLGRAKQSGSVLHIGYISLGSPRSNRAFLDAFKDGLRSSATPMAGISSSTCAGRAILPPILPGSLPPW